MKKQKNNFRRDIINDNNLLDYIDKTNLSSRNKDIMIRYANGTSFRVLADEYGVTMSRITQIVANCVFRCKMAKKKN